MRKYSNQSSIESTDKPNQSTDENMINSLYKGVVPTNDEKSETSNQRPNLYNSKLGSGKVLRQVMTYEFSDSEGSSPKKERASPPLFDNVFKGNTEPTSGGLTTFTMNSKDEMESPTFARNNEVGLSPNFKITSKSSSEFDNKPFSDSPLKQAIQVQSMKSENKKAKAEKKEKKDAHNQKVAAMLEDYKNRKAQSGASLNGMNSLTTINDALNRSKTIFINVNEKEELFGNEFERLDSGIKDIQFFVQALDGFKDENGNFHQDLEPPTSFLELDRSGTNVLETLRTRKTPFELENYQIAEPISLTSADKSSSQKNSTEGSPMAQNTPTRPPNIEPINLKGQNQQSKNSSAKQSPRLMLQQKQMKQVKHQMSLQPTTKSTATESAYTKILSKKSIKPREVELALTYDNNNNPIICQKSSELKSKSQEPGARREASPKKKLEPQSPARKRLYKNTEGSLERSQNTPNKKVGSTEKKTIPKSAASKLTSLVRDSKVNTPLSTPQANSPLRSPETSPRAKPVYAKIIGRNKSPSAGSSQTAFPANNNNKNNLKQPEHNKSKSLGKPALSLESQQPAQQNSGSYAQNALRQKSPSGYGNRIDLNKTPTRSTKRSNDESTKRIHKDSLQDYLTEDSITPSEAELKTKNFKLNLKEENIKPTTAPQEKTIAPPGNLKHFRYPSFGRGGLEKELKQPSTRRNVSQEAQLPEITEVNQTPLSPTEQIGGPHNTQATQEDQSKDYTPVVKTNQSIRSEMKRLDRGARKEPKIAYSSLMKSLELRKNIQNPTNPPLTIDTKPSVYDLSQVNTNLLDPNVDFLSPSSSNNLMQSIYSGSSVDDRNKKVIDIYERNSRWLANKDDRVQGMASLKSKQELQECTFKPVFQKPPLSTGTGYNPKNFYTPMAARLQQASQSPERSFSKEKKAFTSYREINDLKKEINTAPKANHRYYSPKSRFYAAVGKAEV